MVIYLLSPPLSEDIRHDPTALPDRVLRTVQGFLLKDNWPSAQRAPCWRPWCSPLPLPHHHRKLRLIPSKPNTSPELNHTPICPWTSNPEIDHVLRGQSPLHHRSPCLNTLIPPLTGSCVPGGTVSLAPPGWRPCFSHTRGKGSLFLLITASTPCSSLPSKILAPRTPSTRRSAAVPPVAVVYFPSGRIPSFPEDSIPWTTIFLFSISPITMLGDFKILNNLSNTLASRFLYLLPANEFVIYLPLVSYSSTVIFKQSDNLLVSNEIIFRLHKIEQVTSEYITL